MTLEVLPPAPPPAGGRLPGSDSPSPLEGVILRSLVRLDNALVAYERAQRPSVVRRVWRGVHQHFVLRATEWWATALLLQFGWILYFPPAVFPTSPNLAVMADWATEEAWGAGCLVVGSIHLVALIVNGTFPRFRFAPHIRAGASLAACFLWFSIVWAIWQSGIGGTGLGTYRLVLLLEFWNLARASRETGIVDGRRARNAA